MTGILPLTRSELTAMPYLEFFDMYNEAVKIAKKREAEIKKMNAKNKSK